MCAGNKLENWHGAELISAIEVPLVGRLEILRRPRVTFSDTVEYQEACNLHFLDEEQAAAMWYSRSEIEAIRKEARKIVKSHRRGFKFNTENDDCIRGLELYCDRRRKRDVALKITLVLDLQKDNFDEGIMGSAGLAALLQSLSRVDVRASALQANLDFVEAYQSQPVPSSATNKITPTPAA